MFKIKKISISTLKYIDPIDFFANFLNKKYNFLFFTEENVIIGVKPFMILKYENGKTTITFENKVKILEKGIKKILKEINNSLDFNEFPINKIGLMGYFSYDFKDEIEKLGNNNKKNYNAPLIELVLFNSYYLFLPKLNKIYKIDIKYDINSEIKITNQYEKSIIVKNFEEENTKEVYIKKVKKIKDYIFEGDIYEVNFTQQIKAFFKGDSYEIFKRLYKKNPAPFSAYLNYEVTIASNSPELFLEVNDKIVKTKPIKGTIARGTNWKDDIKNKEKLKNSKKDRAELNMIIDLLRNDLSKVCKIGSVKVTSSGHIESFENVHHLVGEIVGFLQFDIIDLIYATFPGGSITGCPKIRAMEIINEIEKFKRNIYTGSIVVINKNNMISNILIRTLIFAKDSVFFNSGGAITIDSDPESEYTEYKAKLSTISKVLGYDSIL